MQHDKMVSQHSNTQITRDQIIPYLKNILAYIGDDPEREGLIDTPERILNSWNQLFSGYGKNGRRGFGKNF